MKCKKCGTKVDKDSLFCEGCGEAVKKKSKTPLYISLIAGVSVLAVIAIVLIFNHVSGAYDRQIELGYDLLEDGKYEEAILAFDKAIEIDEKRPEGYMGKAESMAHDPEMTPEKAEEIVEVLEEGYKKSGDEQVLKHKEKIGEILRENGFEEEAEIVENVGEQEEEKNYSEKEKSENKPIDDNSFEAGQILKKDGYIYYISSGDLYKKGEDGSELMYSSGKIISLATDGKKVYIVDEERQQLVKVDCETYESTDISHLYSELDMQISGACGKYIYIEQWNGPGDYYVKIFNTETEEFVSTVTDYDMGIIKSGKDKIYYTWESYAVGDISTLYEADSDGSNERIITDRLLSSTFEIVGNDIYYVEPGENVSPEQSYDIQEIQIKKYNTLTGEEAVIENIDAENYVQNYVHIVINDIGYGYYKDDYENIPSYKITLFNGTIEKGEGYLSYGKNYFEINPNGWNEAGSHTLLFEDREEKCDLPSEAYLSYYDDGKVYYQIYGTTHSIYEEIMKWEETY